jgi:hypothetical protein
MLDTPGQWDSPVTVEYTLLKTSHICDGDTPTDLTIKKNAWPNPVPVTADADIIKCA